MNNKQLLALCEEAEQLVNELNSLDFKKPEEDVVFMDNLHRMEQLEKQLSGEVPTIVQPKTKKYLQ